MARRLMLDECEDDSPDEDEGSMTGPDQSLAPNYSGTPDLVQAALATMLQNLSRSCYLLPVTAFLHLPVT